LPDAPTIKSETNTNTGTTDSNESLVVRSERLVQNFEMVESPSMNLLDASAEHMFGLMKGLHANQPAPEIRSFDPERVTAACACANTIYKIMRLKLDCIKEQKKK
jgi:hypothetical protein